MKKYVYVLAIALLAMSWAGCQPKNGPDGHHSEMKVIVTGVGVITSDTTIVIHDAMLNVLSGETQMEVRGELKDVTDKLEVTITRSATDRIDEFCVANSCNICNGEETQHLEFNFTGNNTGSSWYAHYNMPQDGDLDYTVSYKFVNYDRQVTLTVQYDYQETN